MEGLSTRLIGFVHIRVVGAEPTRFLEECAEAEITFWGAEPEDEFTLVLSVRFRDLKRLHQLEQRSCCELTVLKKGGSPEYLKRLRGRFAMWVLPLLLGASLIFSSFFVWRIEISGNVTVSETEILNALEASGVYIGSFWPNFTSDSIRNRVLARLPELKWISVSVFGSRASIQVREGTPIPELFDESLPHDVIAAHGGIIEEIYTYRGNQLFNMGQTVAAGDVLISGVMESAFAGSRLVHASGSAEARTWYEISAVLPLEYDKKLYTGESETRYSLVICGNRINFYTRSGILGLKCDNIITERQLGFDELFQLPVTLICERSEKYEIQSAYYSGAQAEQMLETVLYDALMQKIGDEGVIVSAQFSVSESNGFALAVLRAECRQNIAKEMPLTTPAFPAL